MDRLVKVKLSCGRYLRIEEEAPPKDEEEYEEHRSSEPRYIVSIEILGRQYTQANDRRSAADATDEQKRPPAESINKERSPDVPDDREARPACV
jgi:hypothetical protein